MLATSSFLCSEERTLMNVGPALSICATRKLYHHLVVALSPSLLALPLRLSLDPSSASSSNIGAAKMTGKKSKARWMNRRVVESGSMIQS